jgi:serine/threonine protein kinase
MKHVEGHEALRDVINRLRARDPDAQRRFTFEHRVQIIQQVCHALAYAHDRGVSHRDIKPENILLGRRGEVYLADWGIAALRAAAAAPSGSAADGSASGKTGAGTRFAGTLAYMPPERMAGTAPDFDVAGDVYSLCAVLYELSSTATASPARRASSSSRSPASPPSSSPPSRSSAADLLRPTLLEMGGGDDVVARVVDVGRALDGDEDVDGLARDARAQEALVLERADRAMRE